MASAIPAPVSHNLNSQLLPFAANDVDEPIAVSSSGGAASANAAAVSKAAPTTSKSASFWDKCPVLQLPAGLLLAAGVFYLARTPFQTDCAWANVGFNDFVLPTCGVGSLYLMVQGAKKALKLGQAQLKNLGEWISQKKDAANNLFGSRAVVSGLCSASSSVATLFLANYMGVGPAAIVASAGIGLTSSYAMGRILGEEKSLKILALATKSSQNEINAEKIDIPRDGSPLPTGIDILNGEVNPFPYLNNDTSNKKEVLLFSNVRSAFVAAKYPAYKAFFSYRSPAMPFKSQAADAVDKNFGAADPRDAKEILSGIFVNMFSCNRELLYALNQDWDSSFNSKGGLIKQYSKNGIEGLVKEVLTDIIKKYKVNALFP